MFNVIKLKKKKKKKEQFNKKLQVQQTQVKNICKCYILEILQVFVFLPLHKFLLLKWNHKHNENGLSGWTTDTKIQLRVKTKTKKNKKNQKQNKNKKT